MEKHIHREGCKVAYEYLPLRFYRKRAIRSLTLMFAAMETQDPPVNSA